MTVAYRCFFFFFFYPFLYVKSVYGNCVRVVRSPPVQICYVRKTERPR
jgi:hypothetical protein